MVQWTFRALLSILRPMNLRRIRMLRGLSLAALGELIGRDASTVMRAEKMDKTAKLETYQLCADALGVTLSDLFSDDLSPVERELLEVFRRIPLDRRATLADVLRMAASLDRPAG